MTEKIAALIVYGSAIGLIAGAVTMAIVLWTLVRR
jgi:hypothetical protein